MIDAAAIAEAVTRWSEAEPDWSVRCGPSALNAVSRSTRVSENSNLPCRRCSLIRAMILPQRCVAFSLALRDLQYFEKRIADVTQEIEAIAAQDDRARRLMTVPGIGALGATALIAAAGDGQQFHKARDMAAWLGLVPREYSTGGRTTLLGISKRGNRYLRRLLIHGARSCVMHLDRNAIDSAHGDSRTYSPIRRTADAAACR